MEYVVETLRKRNLAYELTSSLKHVAAKVDSLDPDGALADLITYATTVGKVHKSSQALSFKESGPTRVSDYSAVKTLPQGIKTPWEQLNKATLGWVNGTLNVFMAKPNVGKTWMACLQANHAYKQGLKVLFVTMEMPAIRIARRLDALRYKLPFGALRNAELLPTDEATWKAAVDADVTSAGDIIIADKQQVKTVSDIVVLCNYHEPQIVVIDGGYRLEGKGKSSWESVVSVVNDLQLHAELTDVPWIVTTQYGDANDTGKVVRAKGAPKMHMWGARYGKEWVINPDVVIGMHQDPEDRAYKVLRMYLFKTRDVDEDSMFEEMIIHWKLNDMEFGDAGTVAPSGVTMASAIGTATSAPIEDDDIAVSLA